MQHCRIFVRGVLCLPALLVAGFLSLSFCSSAYAAPGAKFSEVATPASPNPNEVIIPGPLRSFLRMAGISQKISPEEVLPLLSRNVFVEGYEGSARPTEFLVLLRRYVVQARELAALAARNDMMIHVAN